MLFCFILKVAYSIAKCKLGLLKKISLLFFRCQEVKGDSEITAPNFIRLRISSVQVDSAKQKGNKM